jgi:hypothetical protein
MSPIDHEIIFELKNENNKWLVLFGGETIVKTSKKSNTIKNFKTSEKIKKIIIDNKSNRGGLFEPNKDGILGTNTPMVAYRELRGDGLNNPNNPNKSSFNEMNRAIAEELKELPFIKLGGVLWEQYQDIYGVVRYKIRDGDYCGSSDM